MNTTAADATRFLAAAEGYAEGQSARFGPVLDELIEWSRERGLTYRPPTGAQSLVRFAVGRRVFWAVTARPGDGAKLTLLNDATFPADLRDAARTELARIDRKPEKEGGVPEVAFAQLIWGPYRQRVLDLMDRSLAAVTAGDQTAVDVAAC